MPFLARKTLKDGNIVPMEQGSSTPSVADFEGGGALDIPGALGGVFGRAAKLTGDDLSLLNDLLGKPIQLGKRLMRLSSVNPDKGMAILHDAGTGERVATPIRTFLDRWKTIGEDTAEDFPEGAVQSQRGVRADGGTVGPRGGLNPLRRRIPPTATR